MIKNKEYLVLEVPICFGPALVGLIVGFMFLPNQLGLLFGGDLLSRDWLQTLSIVWTTIIGWAGMFALLIVLIKIFSPTSAVPNNKFILGIIILSSITLVFGPLGPFSSHKLGFNVLLFSTFLPLLGTVHIAYLARHYLFSQSGNQE